jgi:CRP/FNR family transcriptional regulator, cyclic AMP receptor protein
MDDKLELLGSVPLFGSLSKQELKQVMASGREVEFDAGKDLVGEDDQARDFYLILSGQATVWVRGRRRQKLGPGDHFGEVSVLDGGPRSATVRAEGPVRALRLDRSNFLALLDKHGSIGRKLLVELSSRLRAAEGVLVHW